MDTPVPYWQPGDAAKGSAMQAFWDFARAETGVPLPDWLSLHRWSVDHFRDFWALLLRFLDPVCEGHADEVCRGDDIEHAAFFPQLRLNYAENLLRAQPAEDPDEALLIAVSESGHRQSLNRRQLHSAAMSAASALDAAGIGPESRVAAIANNDAATVVACLASAAVGAAWASVSPGMGAESIVVRLQALQPALLFAHTHSRYQGRLQFNATLIATVLAAVPSIQHVVWLDEDEAAPLARPSARFSTWLQREPRAACTRVPFNHPLFVLFSSGTTGAPKCIVHGHGGTWLEHQKELRLHTGLGPGDRLGFITNTGWMMWNWQISALGAGATVVLYDGSPTHPEPDSLLHVMAANGVTVMGMSPAYLRFLQDADIRPAARLAWPHLRALLSTGSILYEDQYDFVQAAFGALPLQSISGGTDILGCFVLGNPLLPVWRGESQCVSLGLDVRAKARRRDGGADQREGIGELVCLSPFPSRPVGFFGDADGTRFHAAYFAQNPGLWTHGDLIRLESRGSARIVGRSDGVLNIRGIRIGPAELYGVTAGIEELAETLAVDQAAEALPGGRRLVLLVVPKPGVTLDRPLTLRIKREIKNRLSATHVPDWILAVPELPQTHNGKRSERAVQDLLNGRRPRNWVALKNPAALTALLAYPELGIDAGLLREETTGPSA